MHNALSIWDRQQNTLVLYSWWDKLQQQSGRSTCNGDWKTNLSPQIYKHPTVIPFSALTLLAARHEGHLECRKPTPIIPKVLFQTKWRRKIDGATSESRFIWKITFEIVKHVNSSLCVHINWFRMSMKPLLTNHVDRNLTTVVTGAKIRWQTLCAEILKYFMSVLSDSKCL